MIGRTLNRFFDVRPGEAARALALSFYFFLVIAVFWVLKPIKRGVLISYFSDNPLELLGLTFNAAQAEQLGKVMNMFVAYAVVIVFTLIVRRVARRHLVVIFCAIFAGLFVLYAGWLRSLGEGVVWSFYVLGDIYNTAMVATFWAFTNDLNRAGQAKRLYGIIGLGGVVGGFVGASIVAGMVINVGRSALLLVCIVPLVVIAAIALWVDRPAGAEHPDPEPSEPAGEAAADDRPRANAAIEGAKLVLASKYLLGIAAILGLYEVVSNVVDFQLAATVAEQVEGALEKDAFFGVLGQLTGVGSIVIQLIVTTYVMQRFGVKIALFFLPVAILIGSVGFLALPTLAFAGFMSASDNALNYSINQSAKEALYTPTSRDAKYKAKAFIDMFVQRGAKVVAVGLNLGLTALVITQVRWLSIAVVLVILLWLGVVNYLGERFEAQAGGGPPPGPEGAAVRADTPLPAEG